MGKKKKLTPEEEKSLRNEAREGQDASDLLASSTFTNLIKSLRSGCDELLMGLNHTETEAFSFYTIKKDVLKDIVNNLRVLKARGEDAEKVLAGEQPRKKGLL